MGTALTQSPTRACAQYETACKEIERLTRAMGEALDRCSTSRLEQASLDAMFRLPSRTHLGVAYDCITTRGDPDDDRRLRSIEAESLLSGECTADDYEAWDTKREEYIEGHALQCPHCLEAHRLIQQRKDAQQRLGAAKRFVRGVGKRVTQPEAA